MASLHSANVGLVFGRDMDNDNEAQSCRPAVDGDQRVELTGAPSSLWGRQIAAAYQPPAEA